MNLNHLEYFLVLSETMSFSNTAKLLNTSQPAVSKQIKELEKGLGITLFIRDQRSVHLTNEGKELIKQMAGPLREIKKSLDAILNEGTKLQGTISIGAYRTLGESVIFPLLLEFNQLHPDITLDVHFITDDKIISGVKSGELDFGICGSLLEQENLRFYKAMQEEAILVGNPALKNKPLDFKNFKVISYEKEDRLFLKFCKTHYPNLKTTQLSRALMVDSHLSIVEALSKIHNACAVLPLHSVSKQLKSGKLIRLSPEVLKQSLYLLQYETHLPDRKKIIFREFILKSL